MSEECAYHLLPCFQTLLKGLFLHLELIPKFTYDLDSNTFEQDTVCWNKHSAYYENDVAYS
jgi:hypothetical protein